MITYLPLESFKDSIASLSDQMLKNQLMRAKQILDILLGRVKSEKLINHPGIKMWKGYESALILYYNVCIKIYRMRGFNTDLKLEPVPEKIVWPHWKYNEKLHTSHRSNLLRIDEEYYRGWGWVESTTIPYFWPEGEI